MFTFQLSQKRLLNQNVILHSDSTDFDPMIVRNLTPNKNEGKNDIIILKLLCTYNIR